MGGKWFVSFEKIHKKVKSIKSNFVEKAIENISVELCINTNVTPAFSSPSPLQKMEKEKSF